ncbi:hypothetical protein AB21_4086 [Escherichia coli 4-203-08_S1_C1]|nr:hypothetical protein AB21_4086 [Escherichia coli 4-203-08_S1_C1]KEK91609.1 hypothetical protein AB49_4017 [Escherichia coli 4-203-08_S1_C2]KEK96025.1 hypothetical protein AB78_3924 [Escherichia coli 4-203-08_S1_C3]
MPFYFRKECPLNSGYLNLENVNITHWAVMPKAPEAGA